MFGHPGFARQLVQTYPITLKILKSWSAELGLPFLAAPMIEVPATLLRRLYV